MSKLPRAVAKRLPVYYRGVKRLKEKGVDKILSTELADYLNIESTTIRRDFSHLGGLGRQGYGYDIDVLISVLEKELNVEKSEEAILIGVGHLGTALINYNHVRDNYVKITKGFDVRPDLVGNCVGDVSILHVDEIEKSITNESIAILAVSNEVAHQLLPRLKAAGIKGILNFSSARFSQENDVIIHNVDLTAELQALTYFLSIENK